MKGQTNPSRPLPRLFTVADVAAALGVSEKTVRRHIAAGRLSATAPGGGSWRITREAFDAYANGSMKQKMFDGAEAVA